MMMATMSRPAASHSTAAAPMMTPASATASFLVVLRPFGDRHLEDFGLAATQDFYFSFLPDNPAAQQPKQLAMGHHWFTRQADKDIADQQARTGSRAIFLNTNDQQPLRLLASQCRG